jgi:hypothetical protein
VRRFLDQVIRLLALSCWQGGHYHLLWMVYPDLAEDTPGEPHRERHGTVVPDPDGPSVPRMRPSGP